METFRLILDVSEPEYLSLLRLGYRDLRAPRLQAHFLIRQKLIELGSLDEKAIQQAQDVQDKPGPVPLSTP